MKPLFTLLLLALFPFCSYSQQTGQYRHFYYGGSFTYCIPTRDLDKASKYGLGFHLTGEKELNRSLYATGMIGYTHFQGDNNYPDANAFNLEAGFKARVTLFYGAVRLGYYFGDLDQLSFTPLIGIQLRRMDISVGYQFSGSATWAPVQFTYFLNRR